MSIKTHISEVDNIKTNIEEFLILKLNALHEIL